jgi:hypothetical protein
MLCLKQLQGRREYAMLLFMHQSGATVARQFHRLGVVGAAPTSAFFDGFMPFRLVAWRDVKAVLEASTFRVAGLKMRSEPTCYQIGNAQATG